MLVNLGSVFQPAVFLACVSFFLSRNFDWLKLLVVFLLRALKLLVILAVLGLSFLRKYEN